MAAYLLRWLGVAIALGGCVDRGQAVPDYGSAGDARASCVSLRPPAPYGVGGGRGQDLPARSDLLTRCSARPG